VHDLANSRARVFIYLIFISSVTVKFRLGLGLGLGLIISTCLTNLVLQVIWQCDIFGMTPVQAPSNTKLHNQSGSVLCG